MGNVAEVVAALHAASARGARVVAVGFLYEGEAEPTVTWFPPVAAGDLGRHLTRPVPGPVVRRDDDIERLLDWALGNLHEDLSIELLARRAFLSRRSFARRFRAATGTSPYAWVLDQRVRLAQRLLEEHPALGVEEAAGRAGFSSAALLRQHFQRRFGCSPTQYRNRFATLSRE